MIKKDISVHRSKRIDISQINYNFLCTLSTWNIIFYQVERVNKALQAKNIMCFEVVN